MKYEGYGFNTGIVDYLEKFSAWRRRGNFHLLSRTLQCTRGTVYSTSVNKSFTVRYFDINFRPLTTIH